MLLLAALRRQLSEGEQQGGAVLYLYNKKSGEFSPCEGTTFTTHGILERKDIERWVEDNPAILGEDLLVVTSEYDGFDKTSERLDVLALDRDGNLVVVELKRDDSGRNVDLQALKYAAYCSTLQLADVVEMYAAYQLRKSGKHLTHDGALAELQAFTSTGDFESINERPRIILAAREFRSEVTASVLWLRNYGIDITCVKLDPYVVSDDEVALSSSVLIPLPEAKDFVMRVQRKEAEENGLSLTQREYIRFFTQCADGVRAERAGEYAVAAPRAYYQIQTGTPGVHYEWCFHGRPRSGLAVELHCEKADAKQNQAVLAACETVLGELQAALEMDVVVQREKWGRAGSRLFAERHQGQIDDDLRDWAIEKMLQMIRVLQPVLDAHVGKVTS